MDDGRTIAARCRQLLANQPITLEGPGTILKDIQSLIEFIGLGGLTSKSKEGNLPSAVLPELNQRLSDPIEIDLTRALLRDYPNIAGLYVLLRVMELVRAERGRVLVDSQALERWSALNPTERYFALLEAWLIHADGTVLGPGGARRSSQFHENFHFLEERLSSRMTSFADHFHSEVLWGSVSTWNTQLQMRFGLIETRARRRERQSTEGRGWKLQSARRTPWGEAVAWAIRKFLQPRRRQDSYLPELPEDATFGYFQPAFQAYFPEWRTVYRQAEPATRPGTYLFKLTFAGWRSRAGVWRRLAVPHTACLHTLAMAVLKAVGFYDDDHLYEFRYRDSRGKGRVYYHFYTDEGPYADTINVGELDLPEKQSLRFLFDFGDRWCFQLRLERIESADQCLAQPVVIESVGEAPRQYPEAG